MAAIVIGQGIRLARGGIHPGLLARFSVGLSALLASQFCLGAWVIWLLRPPVLTTLHVLNGALMLMTALTLAVHASRLDASRSYRL